MIINSINIQNLFSYSNETIELKDYNVIIGTNASGKTNLVRILKLLSNADFVNLNPNNDKFISIFDLEINELMVFDKTKPSGLTINFLLSNDEIRIIFEYLMKKNLDLDLEWLNPITLTIYWDRIIASTQKPASIFLVFANSFVILAENDNRDLICCFSKKEKTELDTLIGLNYLQRIIDITKDKKEVNTEDINKLVKENININNFLSSNEFESMLIKKRNCDFDFLQNKKILIPDGSRSISYKKKKPVNYIIEILNCCNSNWKNVDGLDTSITLWNILAFMFYKKIVFLNEYRPSHEELSRILNEYEKIEEKNWRFDNIIEYFGKIFPGTEIKVLEESKYTNIKNDQKEKKYYIQIIENYGLTKTKHRLINSASGYYEILSIFSSIYTKENCILILDEPALHLHPIKIKLLGRLLMLIANIQIVIISHSPYFIDVGLFSPGKSLLYTKRDEKGSTILFPKKSYQSTIKAHILKPELFFTKFVLLVEGPGDAAVFTAISDILDNLFEQNDIFILFNDGKGDVHKFIELLDAYNIEYLAIVDSDYLDEFERTAKITVLDNKLEHELQKVGWKGSVLSSIDSDEAYDYIFNLMQTKDGVKQIEKSVFGKLIKKAFKVLGNTSNPFK